MRFLLSVALLTFVYAAVLASSAPLDLLTGAVVSCILLVVFREFLTADDTNYSGGMDFAAVCGRILRFPVFFIMSVVDIVKGTWEVALVVVGVRKLSKPGIIAVPIGERSRVGLVVSAIETTLSPGTYLVEIDHEAEVWYIHVLDATDPDSVRRDREDFYWKYQRGTFP